MCLMCGARHPKLVVCAHLPIFIVAHMFLATGEGRAGGRAIVIYHNNNIIELSRDVGVNNLTSDRCGIPNYFIARG